MSGGVEVTSGGAIEVDTASLTAAADGLDAVAADLDDLTWTAARVRAAVDRASASSSGAAVDTAEAALRMLTDTRSRGGELALRLRRTAHVYEIVELSNERELAAAAGDGAREERAAARLAAARAADPGAALAADELVSEWRQRWFREAAAGLAAPLWAFGPVTAAEVGWLLPLGVAALGGGLVPRRAAPVGDSVPVAVRPTGVPAPVAVRPVGGGLVPRSGVPAGVPLPVAVRPVGVPAAPTAPPADLAAAISRIPSGIPDDDDADGRARVRVERCAMPDGAVEYVAYVAGTQDWVPPSDDALDLESNVRLYAGGEAESSEAVRAALTMSGAEPGDSVSLVGFSQGGMAAAHVAQDGTYDVAALLVAGSPTSADLAETALSVSLEHADDPVVALQGTFDAGVQGSADSVVVRRTVDPAWGPADLVMPAHRQHEYVETAQRFEESGDPRVAAVDALFERLATATEVTVTEYAAVTAR